MGKKEWYSGNMQLTGAIKGKNRGESPDSLGNAIVEK